jgi:hypothetical protein
MRLRILKNLELWPGGFGLAAGRAQLQNTKRRLKLVQDYVHYEKFNSWGE